MSRNSKTPARASVLSASLVCTTMPSATGVRARRLQLRHLLDLHQAHAARRVDAQSRGGSSSRAPRRPAANGGLQHRGALRDGHRCAVDCERHLFHGGPNHITRLVAGPGPATSRGSARASQRDGGRERSGLGAAAGPAELKPERPNAETHSGDCVSLGRVTMRAAAAGVALCLHAGAAGAQPVDVLTSARVAATSGHRAEALADLEQHLSESPRDVDARLVRPRPVVGGTLRRRPAGARRCSAAQYAFVQRRAPCLGQHRLVERRLRRAEATCRRGPAAATRRRRVAAAGGPGARRAGAPA